MNAKCSIFLAILTTVGCVSEAALDATRPDYGSDLSQQRAISTDATPEPERPTATAAAASSVEDGVPRAFTAALARYTAALQRLYDAMAAENDCDKLAATVTAFAADETTRAAARVYNAAEAGLTDAQRDSLQDQISTSLLKSLGGMMDAHLRCVTDPVRSKRYNAAILEAYGALLPASER
jgi:hypothetical protein